MVGALPAGTAIIGKVGIDQTTLGTTNGVQEIPGAAFGHASKTTNAATAVQLAAGTATRSILVTAKDANTGYVYVGGSAVSSASYGKRLTAGQSIPIAVANLNLVYIDVSVSGEGVDILYVV